MRRASHGDAAVPVTEVGADLDERGPSGWPWRRGRVPAPRPPADTAPPAPAAPAPAPSRCPAPCARCLGTVTLTLPIGYVAMPERGEWPPARPARRRGTPRPATSGRRPRADERTAGGVDTWATPDGDDGDDGDE